MYTSTTLYELTEYLKYLDPKVDLETKVELL
jgi:hypothetical protein